MIQTQLRRGIVILLWAGVLLAAVLYPLSTAVLAHADYDSAVPAAGEVVSQSPQRVQVWFTQELFRREGQNSLEVYGPDDQRVDQDDAAIDDDNRKLMTVSMQSDLPNGVYTVRWRTLSADDGDDAEGEFQFTIQADEPGAEATPTATSTPAPTVTEEADQPSPTDTATPESAETESTPPDSDQADQGPGIPCMGSSFPVLLLLGAFLLARRRKGLGESRSPSNSRGLSGKNG
ncbi:MAG: copper resistance protein CopC [Caldilineaceae bacterium]|nr:copper resistance protein CopC [Caldilineaceae bacterium]MDE0196720.1 copper resistance protein CopC [Caldilineaceae bacterium]